MQGRAHLDGETASPQPLGNQNSVGVHRYFEDPRTIVWGFRYKFSDNPTIGQWRPGWTPPLDLLDHIARGGTVVAHNAVFERWMWHFLRIKYGLEHWPALKIEQQICTMAKALAMNLPGSLDGAASELKLSVQKDLRGQARMRKISKPTFIDPRTGECKYDHPQEEIDYVMNNYCADDVLTEEALDEALPDLTPYEQQLWALDQRMNDRGVKFDIPTAVRAMELRDHARTRADKEMYELTGGRVTKCSQTERIVTWINAQGIPCESIKKGDQDDIIAQADTSGSPQVRRAIELRRSAAKTSTAKFPRIVECAGEDDRLRGTVQFNGASQTGRWAGRLIQTQNFPRVDDERQSHIPRIVIDMLKSGHPINDIYTMLKLVVGSPLEALALTLRACIIAETECKLIGGDFSNIEGRVNAWLARCEWKLEAFRMYDLKLGPDLYKITAASILGKRIDEITGAERQAYGKVPELALGYQGGVGAFITMGDTYGVDPADMIGPVKANIPPQQWDEIATKYAASRDKMGLPEDQWVAVKATVINWRKKHPEIVESWWELADAAIDAVDFPGRIVYAYAGRVAYWSQPGWLYCRLPSGRVICYPGPNVRESIQTFVNKDGEEYERVVRSVHYVGRGKDGVWGNRVLYGGLQCENIVQACSRCILDRSMFRVENAGYPLILTVHDELLAEVRREFGNPDHFAEVMSQKEDWYADLPVSVAAWEGDRYA